jgi:hypothetical protein
MSRGLMMGECIYCLEETSDVEEYCHHCGEIVCFECLKDEWCNACLLPQTTEVGSGL